MTPLPTHYRVRALTCLLIEAREVEGRAANNYMEAQRFHV
jgi:hypothetical protein